MNLHEKLEALLSTLPTSMAMHLVLFMKINLRTYVQSVPNTNSQIIDKFDKYLWQFYVAENGVFSK